MLLGRGGGQPWLQAGAAVRAVDGRVLFSSAGLLSRIAGLRPHLVCGSMGLRDRTGLSPWWLVIFCDRDAKGA